MYKSYPYPYSCINGYTWLCGWESGVSGNFCGWRRSPLWKGSQRSPSTELAFGSESRPCRNNAVSRSPSSNHPSSAAARPDATFLWLTLPTDRKKHAGDGNGLGVLSWNVRPVQNIPISIEEYRNGIGTAYHHKYRRIQKPDRHNVPFWVPQHTDKSQQRSAHNNEELLPCPRGWGCRGRAFGLRNSEMAFPLHIPALKMRPA